MVVLWHLGGLRQEDREFRASLGYRTVSKKITEQEGHFCPVSPEAVAKAFAGPAPSQSSEACHPWPPREQGSQEVSGCPLLLALGLAYTWRLETHQETGAWVEPVCRRLCNIWQPCPF